MGKTNTADKLFAGYLIFWLIWFLVKIPFLIILIVNIIDVIAAVQQNTIGTFNFTWLVVSIAGVIFL